MRRIDQLFSNLIPRQAVSRIASRARIDSDIHVRVDRQAVMRQVDLQARHRIAKGILPIDPERRLRCDHHLVAHRGLMRHGSWREPQHLMRMHNLSAIHIAGQVTHTITVGRIAHAATVRTSMPVCEKCRMLKRSHRRPASKFKLTSASAKLARARVPAALV